jgi:uncharacterized membrane protein (DUF373 family)
VNEHVPLSAKNDRVSIFFEGASRLVLSLLLTAISIAILSATIKTLFNLKNIFDQDLHNVLKTVMVNSLTILALLEVFRTCLTYFSEGRVKVTYIIDTVLVVILTEVMVFWFKEISFSRIFMVIALVLSLVVARILVIRFSPGPYAGKTRNEEDNEKFTQM